MVCCDFEKGSQNQHFQSMEYIVHGAKNRNVASFQANRSKVSFNLLSFSKYSFGRVGGGGSQKKKNTLCTLLIMLIILNDTLQQHIRAISKTNDPLQQHIRAISKTNDPLQQHIRAISKTNDPLQQHIRAISKTVPATYINEL